MKTLVKLSILVVLFFVSFVPAHAQAPDPVRKTAEYKFDGVKYFAWSPNGAQIAIERENEYITILAPDLNISSLQAGFDPVWSPNSKLLSFVRRTKTSQDVDSNVYVFDFQKPEFAVTDARFGYSYYDSQIFSPDSTWLILSGGNGNLMKIRLGYITPFWLSRGQVDSPLTWTESEITFSSLGREPYGIWRMDVDGSKVRFLRSFRSHADPTPLAENPEGLSPNSAWKTVFNKEAETLTITRLPQ